MKPIVLDPNAFGTSFGACFWLLSFLRWAAWQAFDISLPRRLLVYFFLPAVAWTLQCIH